MLFGEGGLAALFAALGRYFGAVLMRFAPNHSRGEGRAR
jgi:hypothetical protein